MGIQSVAKIATILSGAAISDAINTTGDFYLAGILHPVITISTAFTFQVSNDGITYLPLYDAGSPVSYTIDPAVPAAVTVAPSTFYAWEYVKFVVADNQAADRTITAIVRQY